MGLNLPVVLVAISGAAIVLCAVLIAIVYFVLSAGPKPSSPNRDVELGDKEVGEVAKLEISHVNEAEVQRYEWREVKALIGELASAAVIGQGGFSNVYLAHLPDSSHAALKVYAGGGGELPRRAFRQELDVLCGLRHPRVVRLLGYCADAEEDQEGVLVLEYVPNGTLHERLHGGGGDSTLPWAARMRIAYEVADAIEYLHAGGGSNLPIVHGDLTAANVLLDADLGPKLCDFGSARVGFSAAVRPAAPVMGSPGYTDPHYLLTGIASKKTDVYSFGVLLLELLTGVQAAGAEDGMTLVAVMAPRLRDAGRGVAEALDPGMGGEYDAAEVVAVAAIAVACVGERPASRPSMAEIRRKLREAAESSSSMWGSEMVTDAQIEKMTKWDKLEG